MANNRRHEAWAAGQKAALDGKPESSCRRRPGTIFYDDWHDGYWSVQHLTKATLPELVADRRDGL